MLIRTPSRRLALAAWLTRLMPPGLSGALLTRLYPDALARAENAPFVRRSALADVTYRFPRADYIATRFGIRGFYEWHNIIVAKTVCGPGDTIVEVGANVGTETLLFAKIVGAQGRVVAFEPSPANAAILRELSAENGLSQLTVVEAAVSSCEGRLRFQPLADGFTSGEGHLVAEGGSSEEGSFEVEVVTLDAWTREGRLPAPRLVVSDTEGAELQVLRGMQALIEEQRPVVVLENEPRLLAAQAASSSELHDFLSARGYGIHAYSGRGVRPIARDRAEQARGNWLGLPPDSSSLRAELDRSLRRAAWRPPLRGISPLVLEAP